MKVVHVAAGVIWSPDGKILISKRLQSAHQGGLWEFPGGKVEAGETVEAALVRELQEELAIHPEQFSPLIRIRHDYPDKSVLLDVWSVTAFSGTPHGREGQQIRWVTRDELSSFAFPEANRPIVTAAQLSSELFITPDADNVSMLLTCVETALKGRDVMVQLRQHSWSENLWREALVPLSALCQRYQTVLMLNNPPEMLTLGEMSLPTVAGVHLPAYRLSKGFPAEWRDLGWLSAACHSQHELQLAQEIGVDFITLSPILASDSHPEQLPLGWDALQQFTELAKVPVFALGGMSPDLRTTAQQHGAQGVAGIRGWL